MAKIFYTATEAAAKLNATEEELKRQVAAGKLREFGDGGRFHYKVDDVEHLLEMRDPQSDVDHINLLDRVLHGTQANIDKAQAMSANAKQMLAQAMQLYKHTNSLLVLILVLILLVIAGPLVTWFVMR